MIRSISRHLQKPKQLLCVTTTVLSLLMTVAAGHAEEPSPTLRKIAETGLVRIGYSAEDFPFSYRQPDGTVTGYSTELCLEVVATIRDSLKLASVKVEYVERNPRNRVSMLRNGDFDIECVASTNNAERRKSVGFSYPHFVTGTQFVSLKKSNLKTIADLAGHTVAATSGTTNIGQLNTMNRERALNIAVVPVETHKDALQLVREGRAAAFVMDGILLAAMVAKSPDPEQFSLSTEALGWPEPYGLMVRLDDTGFRNSVNSALKKIYASGKIEELYEKWFNAPVPPMGINMRLPMSAEIRAAFANPVDPAD
ncbi:amino acid ABC transporter substrate-binding protein [Rhizobium sp. CECT 9324]|uniref:amino acid ABC transporter substrate-binding protein n=1 Tax=Rhizobium sp. CECT 9324 TaxID=2845820 RepID=UPI000DE0BF72|nr:amino acid ABC transporter substrate-binding protein [Rhizobium sp. CECT 9324]CAH0343449.1 Glutamate/aspartate import solute-binding protein [Rhizobium sp. CECT 9324]